MPDCAGIGRKRRDPAMAGSRCCQKPCSFGRRSRASAASPEAGALTSAGLRRSPGPGASARPATAGLLSAGATAGREHGCGVSLVTSRAVDRSRAHQLCTIQTPNRAWRRMLLLFIPLPSVRHSVEPGADSTLSICDGRRGGVVRRAPAWRPFRTILGYMLRSRRMRSSMGGCVLNRLLRKLWCSRSGL